MKRVRCGQRDLFAQETAALPLRPDLRSKLEPLLRCLLAEAAGVQRADVPPSKEGADDQDHA